MKTVGIPEAALLLAQFEFLHRDSVILAKGIVDQLWKDDSRIPL